MNRRGFLGAILAAGTAPLVLRSGIARGILMPGRPRRMAGAHIDVFSAAGILLASVPYDDTLMQPAPVLMTGYADYCRIHGVPAVPEGHITREIAFSNAWLIDASMLTVADVHFVGN